MEIIKITQFLVYISHLYFKTRIVYSIILFDAQTSKKSETAIFFFPFWIVQLRIFCVEVMSSHKFVDSELDYLILNSNIWIQV